MEVLADMLNLSYVAGFFDGEGCVSLKVNAAANLAAEVTVGNTNLDIVTRLHEEFGGKLYTRRKDEGHKTVYVWRKFGREAVSFLLLIRDHLIVKRPIADLVINAYTLQDAGEMNRQLQEKVVATARHFNHRGD